MFELMREKSSQRNGVVRTVKEMAAAASSLQLQADDLAQLPLPVFTLGSETQLQLHYASS